MLDCIKKAHSELWSFLWGAKCKNIIYTIFWYILCYLVYCKLSRLVIYKLPIVRPLRDFAIYKSETTRLCDL